MDMNMWDEDTVIHLLGYVNSSQFADAMMMDGLDKETIREIVRELEERYSFSLMPDVEKKIKVE
jgi:hypothetical protein